MTSTSFNTFASKAVQNEGAFEEMRSHILKMYAGVTVHEKVASFVNEGQHVDCIAIMEQPTVFHLGIKQIKKPPMPMTPSTGSQTKPATISYADSLLKQGLKDQFGNAISCPVDTIPMPRLTMDKLTQFPTLTHFFAKHPSSTAALQPRGGPVPKVTLDPMRKSTAGHQTVVNYGGNSWMELWLPVGDYSVGHQRYSSGTPLQTVEGGWAVYPQHFQTTNAVLYVYWSSGSNGCYNLDCPEFIQVDNTWALGGGFPSHYSTPQKRWWFQLQWKLLKGDWWLFLDGTGTFNSVGYYPMSIYGGGQLSRNAEHIKFGGEVGRFGEDPWPQMGNGVMSSSSAAAVTAASQFLIYYDPHDQDGGTGVDADLIPLGDLPCYSVNVFKNGSLAGSGALIHYGGGGGKVC